MCDGATHPTLEVETPNTTVYTEILKTPDNDE
jgi:hypothetical protein